MRIAAATIAAVLWLVAAVQLWETQVPPLELVPAPAEQEFESEQLRESAAFARLLRALWIASGAAQLVTLAVLAWSAPRLEPRLRGGRLLQGLALLALALVALWIVRLPFRVVAHWWRRRHGLSEQAYVAWLVDPWPELLATLAVATAAVVAAMLLAGRLGRRWWLAGGPALAIVGSSVALAQPLVESPRLEPLADAGLEREILAVAERMGVPAVAVEVKDASRRTTRVNAEVVGAGVGRRVILWDTLLDGRLSEAEIRFVVAHELAHVERAHVRKGIAWFALLALPLAFVLARATEPRGGLARPAAVPLGVLVVVALQLALLPFVNAVSRRYEAEADWLALSATGDPAAARAVFRSFAKENLAQPDPPRWAVVVLGTHPPLVERLALADAFSRSRAARSREGS